MRNDGYGSTKPGVSARFFWRWCRARSDLREYDRHSLCVNGEKAYFKRDRRMSTRIA